MERQLIALAALVSVERRHWAAFSPPFPFAALLRAGDIAAQVRSLESEALRTTMERYDELAAELKRQSTLLETDVGQFVSELQKATDKVDEAVLDLEEEGTKLKRARRNSGTL